MVELDPVQAALVAAGTLVAKDAASETVKDAYQGLKALIKGKLGSHPQADVILDSLDTKPDVWTEPLRDLLEGSKASSDSSVIQAAQELLEMIGSSQIAIGDHNTQISGNVQTLVQGNYIAGGDARPPAEIPEGFAEFQFGSTSSSKESFNFGVITTSTLYRVSIASWHPEVYFRVSEEILQIPPGARSMMVTLQVTWAKEESPPDYLVDSLGRRFPKSRPKDPGQPWEPLLITFETYNGDIWGAVTYIEVKTHSKGFPEVSRIKGPMPFGWARGTRG